MPRGEVTARHNGSGIHPPRGEDMAQQPTWELKTLSSSTALWATSAPNIGTVSWPRFAGRGGKREGGKINPLPNAG